MNHCLGIAVPYDWKGTSTNEKSTGNTQSSAIGKFTIAFVPIRFFADCVQTISDTITGNPELTNCERIFREKILIAQVTGIHIQILCQHIQDDFYCIPGIYRTMSPHGTALMFIGVCTTRTETELINFVGSLKQHPIIIRCYHPKTSICSSINNNIRIQCCDFPRIIT